MNFLIDMGIVCTLGDSKALVADRILKRGCPVPNQQLLFSEYEGFKVGSVWCDTNIVPGELAEFCCRNNAIAVSILEQLHSTIERQLERYGRHRIGVVLGTSTSGIEATQEALNCRVRGSGYTANYHAVQGALGGLGEFVARYLSVTGPVYTVSTACTSSGNAILSGNRLIKSGICDCVIVGGVDSLCRMTLNGFGALEALSAQYATPFSKERDGINVGEGGAIFVLSKEEGLVGLRGGAASSDAHHMSAPDPQAIGAILAIEKALKLCGISASEIDYLNLHGTGTQHNDAMESIAVNQVFGTSVPCSTTKIFTGHVLGATAAIELAICWLLLNFSEKWRLPPSLAVGDTDSSLAPIALTGSNDHSSQKPRLCMSNSFAFGGSNTSIIIGRN